MKQVTYTKFTSTTRWGDLSKIRDLFAAPLKLLRGPQGNGGSQFENHWYMRSNFAIKNLFFGLLAQKNLSAKTR